MLPTGVHFESYAGEARILKTTRSRVWLSILALTLVALPVTAGPYLLGQMTYMFITLMAVYGLYVTVGMAGQINIAWNSPLAWVRARRLARARGVTLAR